MKRTDYISWDDFFMGVAKLSAQRSKDPSTQVGTCIVKDNKIVGVGYNGFPNGIPDDEPMNFPWTANIDPLKSKYSYVVHAELNAILNTTDRGQLGGSTMYCTLPPCNECVKAIAQVGITKLVYEGEWRDTDYHDSARHLLHHLPIELIPPDLPPNQTF